MDKTNNARPTPNKYDKLEHLSDDRFKRLTSVKRSTFSIMVEDLMEAEIAAHAYGGRPNKLCVEDRLLMALEYNREYRTYFHVGENYGVSESNAYKIIRWVKDTLIKNKRFAHPQPFSRHTGISDHNTRQTMPQTPPGHTWNAQLSFAHRLNS